MLTTAEESYIARYAEVAAQNRHHLATLKELWTEFDAKGLEVLPLKGIDLILRGYRSLGQRTMYDLDLLVRPEDKARLCGILDTRGYRPIPKVHYSRASFFDPDTEYLSPGRDVSLDITWGIWYLPDTDALWRRRVRRQTCLGDRLLLHPEDTLLYLIAYTVAHRGQLSPAFVEDLSVLLEKEGASIDWPRWCAQVRACKLSPAVQHGLDHAKARGGIGVPDAVFAELSPRGSAERILLKYYQRRVTERPRPDVDYLFALLSAPGWTGKKRLLQRVLGFSHTASTPRRGVLRNLVKPFQLAIRGAYYIPRDLIKLFKA